MTDAFISTASLLPVGCALAATVVVALLADRSHITVANRMLAVIVFAASVYASASLIDVDASAFTNAHGVFVAMIGVVGASSLLVSDAMLVTKQRSFFELHARRRYYLCMYGFWATMLAIPLTTNLAVAWVLIEVTTGISGLLVAFSGRPRALEAAWKYVVLTTLGLAVSLLGITILFANAGQGSSIDGVDFHNLGPLLATMPPESAILAVALIIVGLAGKIGWAPVHNWLPDAHGEAPPPVSAMLSAALLPTVAFVCWQILHALPEPVAEPIHWLVIAFGIASLGVAAAFLSLPLPFKRMLAYSSLEHMGVVAIGIGIGSPLAALAVVVQVAAHAVAKAVAFDATILLIARNRDALARPLTNISTQHRGVSWLIGGSMAALAAVPPSPLFVSEVLVIYAAIAAGHLWLATITSALLALGFVGLSRATIRAVAGDPLPHSGRASNAEEVLAG